MKKELLFKLWAYDAEAKMWEDRRDKISPSSLNVIEKIQKEQEEIRRQLHEFIENQKDPYIRVLLTYRCIERKSWKEIANALGGSAESHRKTLSRFIDGQQ